MRVKYLQYWLPANYKKSKHGSFEHWSNLARGKGDPRLPQRPKNYYKGFLGWLRKNWEWKKCIILKVVGKPEAEFVVGYRTINSDGCECKISSDKKIVANGPFAMRLGREDCEFFIISNEPSIRLEFLGYMDRDSVDANSTFYKKIIIN